MSHYELVVNEMLSLSLVMCRISTRICISWRSLICNTSTLMRTSSDTIGEHFFDTFSSTVLVSIGSLDRSDRSLRP